MIETDKLNKPESGEKQPGREGNRAPHIHAVFRNFPEWLLFVMI
jgi:hypothetical protein